MENTHETQHGSGSVKAYIFGFILSIILTAIPFYMVMNGMIKGNMLITIVLILAVAQLLVQLYMFMHLGDEESPKYNQLSTAYAIMTIVIMAVGSVWIMFSLDHFGAGHSTGLQQRGIDHEVHD